jgi:hypothetical protein
MAFLAPLMLLGSAAVSIPIVLHFFYKARYRPLPWAAMRFLKISIEQTSRRLKFQEWILLALRCLCLILLAFALARPSCTLLTSGGRGDSVDAILIFDTSYSMGARDGEQSRWDRAKSAAQTIIEHLPANSTVQIITNSNLASAVGPQNPSNLDQARKLIDALELTSRSSDVLPGLQEAILALDRGAGLQKEVYFLTDLQRSAWEQQPEAVKAAVEQLRSQASLLIVRCGHPERPVRNVAITELQSPGGIPHSGSRLPVTIVIKNTSPEPVKNLTVTLQVDGRTVTQESGSITQILPGQSFPLTLTANLDLPGPRLVTATVQPDDLPGDNRYQQLIFVRDQLRVLVVDGAPNRRQPEESASYFLRNALLPIPPSEVDRYFVKVTVVPPEEAAPGLLELCDICILCNVPASSEDRPGLPGLNPDFLDKLPRFVREGGGLIIGSGDRIVPERYNRLLGPEQAGLLPFPLGTVRTTTWEAPFRPAPETTESPGFLARFREEPFRTVTAETEWIKVIPLREPAEEPGRILMRLTDGTPWLAAKPLGQGEVIFVGVSLDTSWGNWPARAGSYVPFVQLSLGHLTSQAATPSNLIAGEPIFWKPKRWNPGGYDLIFPDDHREKLLPDEPTETGQPSSGTFRKTDLAGVYRIEPLNLPTPAKPTLFAVVPDLKESAALETFTTEQLRDWIGDDLPVILAGDDSDNRLITERSRREWTIWLLLFLFGLTLVEGSWAWLCGRAW